MKKIKKILKTIVACLLSISGNTQTTAYLGETSRLLAIKDIDGLAIYNLSTGQKIKDINIGGYRRLDDGFFAEDDSIFVFHSLRTNQATSFRIINNYRDRRGVDQVDDFVLYDKRGNQFLIKEACNKDRRHSSLDECLKITNPTLKKVYFAISMEEIMEAELLYDQELHREIDIIKNASFTETLLAVNFQYRGEKDIVRIFDRKSKIEVLSITISERVIGLTLSESNQLISVATRNGIQVWSIEDSMQILKQKLEAQGTKFYFSPGDLFLYSKFGTGRFGTFYKISLAQIADNLLPPSDQIMNVCFSTDQKFMLVMEKPKGDYQEFKIENGTIRIKYDYENFRIKIDGGAETPSYLTFGDGMLVDHFEYPNDKKVKFIDSGEQYHITIGDIKESLTERYTIHGPSNLYDLTFTPPKKSWSSKDQMVTPNDRFAFETCYSNGNGQYILSIFRQRGEDSIAIYSLESQRIISTINLR